MIVEYGPFLVRDDVKGWISYREAELEAAVTEEMKAIIVEALEARRRMYQSWNGLGSAGASEKAISREKVRLIDATLREVKKIRTTKKESK